LQKNEAISFFEVPRIKAQKEAWTK
jgi:hypothetical protein